MVWQWWEEKAAAGVSWRFGVIGNGGGQWQRWACHSVFGSTMSARQQGAAALSGWHFEVALAGGGGGKEERPGQWRACRGVDWAAAA